MLFITYLVSTVLEKANTYIQAMNYAPFGVKTIARNQKTTC